jgi:hypothetical protein
MTNTIANSVTIQNPVSGISAPSSISHLPSPTSATSHLSSSPVPTIHQSINPSIQPPAPRPEPVDGNTLLTELASLLRLFVVLPPWAAETLALWTLHTYAFELRDISTYIGIESPTRRCGKTTLLTILAQLVNRPLVAANVSSPSFFRAIEELRPTLMIDEADRFLKGKADLQGILNAGYCRKTAFVLRVAQQLSRSESNGHSSTLAYFSCWCPKVIAQIGHLPGTLADRCIVLRMQRKTWDETCERLRNLDTEKLRRQCIRFVQDHAQAIAAAKPIFPAALNDRAADIWEPLLALADLAGGSWPELARQAATHLSAGAQDRTPIGSLLLDIFLIYSSLNVDRIFTRDLVEELNLRRHRTWAELLNVKEVTERWLAFQLRPFNIRPRTLRIGEVRGKGYLQEDFKESSRRYVSRSDLDALKAELGQETPPAQNQKPDEQHS